MAKRNRSRNTRFEVRSYNEQERMSTTRRIMTYLRSLANRRSTGTVSADDVHNYLTRDGVREQQVRTRLSFINSVFSSDATDCARAVLVLQQCFVFFTISSASNLPMYIPTRSANVMSFIFTCIRKTKLFYRKKS